MCHYHLNSSYLQLGSQYATGSWLEISDRHRHWNRMGNSGQTPTHSEDVIDCLLVETLGFVFGHVTNIETYPSAV